MLQYIVFSKQKTFINQVKALNKGQVADSHLIWKAFQGPNSQQNISYYCLQLFQHVINSDKKMYLLQNQERLYATLLCLQLLKNKKPKSPQIVQECRNYIEKKGPSHGKSLMQFLFKTQRSSETAQFFISRLVMAPLQIDWNSDLAEQFQRQLKQGQRYQNRIKSIQPHKNYDILKTQSFPKFKAVQTKLLTFGYVCFTQHIKNNNLILTKIQYQHLVDVTKFLMHAIKTVEAAYQYLPKILHLSIKCITFYGCYYQDVLKDFIILADKLKCFPGIIGEMGTQFFNILIEQIKLPGSSFRKKLRRDFPSLDIKQNKFINRQVYLVTDQQDLFSRHQNHSLTTLRKLIIIHCVKISRIPQKQVGQIIQFVKDLNEQRAFMLYDKIIKITELLSKLENVGSIRQFLKQNIFKLIKQMHNKLQKSQELRGGAQQKIDEIQIQQFKIFCKRMNSFGYFEYPKYEIISVSIQDFISESQTVNSLNRIIKKHKADYSGKNLLRTKIPILFNGDGQTFSKFLKAIIEYQEKTSVQEVKQFQIYYLPKHENTCRVGIGKFIACKDAWYRKFVYNIHCQKTFYPYLQLNQQNKELFPFDIENKNLQLYLRQANYTLPIRIYKCTLTMNQTNQVKIVYMASFFMMGLFCQAKIIKMQKEREKGKQERYQNKQLIEIIEEKIKKINIMSISLEVESVEPFTNQIRVKKENKIRIQDIQVCNISYDYFMGRQPNCTSPYLQMSILTENNGKIFIKQIVRSDNFKQNKSVNEIFNAFDDLFICRTIRSIQIQSQDVKNGMRFMIDGIVYSKVHSLKIEPMYSANQVPIILPIQVFSPFK